MYRPTMHRLLPVSGSPFLRRFRRGGLVLLGLGLTVACGGASAEPPATQQEVPQAPTDKSELSSEQKQEFDQISAELKLARAVDAQALLQKRKVNYLEDLPYDPLSSEFLDTIQTSALGLNEAELAKLGDQGFVIAPRQSFPNFVSGYAAIYSENLPVYISADAILEAVHASYDGILLQLELQALIPLLDELLSRMHGRLSQLQRDEAAVRDLDLYLAVARSLLAGLDVPTQAGADSAAVREWVEMARREEGMLTAQLFGMERLVDTSQFRPRGHYEDREELQNYFRAMMWLGRIDFRIIETLPDGTTRFNASQYAATLMMRELMTEQDVTSWKRIDDTIRGFVGESDNMVLSEVEQLTAQLGGADAARAATEDQIRAAFTLGGYGMQNIASHLMVNDGRVETLPLNRSFLLFGQRYILDSHVFSQVVFDRIGKRMMPDPLDAAYAALGNDGALPLLPELEAFPKYPGALEAVRVLGDAHGEEFWGGNLYNLWSSALREMSPRDGLESGTRPTVAKTEAWNRRVLNTQLASWAELRHDTLLYAKQSYSGIPACDFPAAYVDPYPELFARLASFAEYGSGLSQQLSGVTDTGHFVTYFESMREVMVLLSGMAQAQLDGIPFTAEQLAFVNRAVRVVQQHAGCTTISVPDGWLAELYFDPSKSIEFDPTIADVHTQPADVNGNPVGKVLHVGTGYPRLMVVTTEGCEGPRAYAGVTFSYHEKITGAFDRLTDSRWAEDLRQEVAPPSPPWLQPVLGQ